MSESELDKLYFPHKWVKRLPSDVVLVSHIEFFNKKSEEAKKTIKCEFNLPYGIQPRECMDILGIDLPDDAPIFVHIHGGYWQLESINRTNQTFIGTCLHKYNIKCITVGYELCPNVTVLEIMKSVENAIKRCLTYAKAHKSKGIFLSGHSSGAHLVASLFTDFIKSLSKDEQELIKGVFLSCGLYDLTPLTETMINLVLKLNKDSAMEASPMFKNITANSETVFYIMTAEYDSPAFVQQSKRFYDRLVEGGIKAEYHLLRGIDHFEAVEKIVEDDHEVTQLILNAIKKVK